MKFKVVFEDEVIFADELVRGKTVKGFGLASGHIILSKSFVGWGAHLLLVKPKQKP